MKNAGILYIVATPIGNLEDITFRAVRILEEVDVVLCEDTRVTHKLLEHYHLETKTMSYFQHSALAKVDTIIKMLEDGAKMALVTDAGTPGISDPGQALIHSIQMADNSIPIIPIPGPSALTATASVSGMIEKEFYFAGFLPKKKGRQTEFKLLSLLNCPIVIYESPLRLERTLKDISEYFGSKTEVFIAREVTKMFEEYWGGKILKVMSELSEHTLKGEVVLIVKRSKNIKGADPSTEPALSLPNGLGMTEGLPISND